MTTENQEATLRRELAHVQRDVYTWEDVAEHSTAKDAWIVIKGRVYDVTSFAKMHPGGDIILTAAGQDATDVFAGFHTGTDSWRLLPALCIGEVKGTQLPEIAGEEYMKDISNMRQELHKAGSFKSNKLYYLWKFFSTTMLCVSSILLLCFQPNNPMIVTIAAIVLALFWQQCGWLAHDFLHHQVFHYRGFNNLMGLIVGNLYQGFSVNWWKNKHNHHHAVPNVTDAPSGGDPDIATMPILFWSEKLFEGDELDKLPKWMLRNQGVLYWPIMCFARLSWLMQSALYQREPVNAFVTSGIMYMTECLLLLAHHLAFLYVVSLIPNWGLRLVFASISQALGGLFIAVVFTVGHNAMDVFSESELRGIDFLRLQVLSTRDVTPHWFTDWFCGGLNYQIEHHLYPTIPRHNLPYAAKLLRSFCSKYNIPYTVDTLIEGNRQVWDHLAVLAKSA